MKKLNWGHGIFIAISIMVLAILTMVLILTNEKIELVADDYYPKGIHYEIEITKQRNNASLSKAVKIELSDSLQIIFPDDFKQADSLKGEIWFYKASDKSEDIKHVIDRPSSRVLTFPLNLFSYGKYDVIIDWSYEGKAYYFKESIFIDKE